MLSRLSLMSWVVALTLAIPSAAFAQDEDLDEELGRALLEGQGAEGDAGGQEAREAFKKAVLSMDADTRKDRSLRRIKSMRESRDATDELLQNTRDADQVDFKKLNCINDKLIAIKGFLKVSESSYAELVKAEQERDSESIAHYYTLIAVGYSKVGDLERDARMCVGAVTDVSEAGQSSYTSDPEVVPLDPVLPGGYVELEEAFGDIFDPVKLPPLTPLQ